MYSTAKVEDFFLQKPRRGHVNRKQKLILRPREKLFCLTLFNTSLGHIKLFLINIKHDSAVRCPLNDLSSQQPSVEGLPFSLVSQNLCCYGWAVSWLLPHQARGLVIPQPSRSAPVPTPRHPHTGLLPTASRGLSSSLHLPLTFLQLGGEVQEAGCI